MKSIFLCISILAITVTAEMKKPNFIFFLVDDYDKAETSVYGGNVLTPNLERLAQEGMTFHNAYVTSTVCTPSRYTMLTGRYAGSSYAKDFMGLFPAGQQSSPGFNMHLEADNKNVGAALSAHGYTTGFVGKYHVGPHEVKGAEGYSAIEKHAPFTEKNNQIVYNNEKYFRRAIKGAGFDWAKNIYWGNMAKNFKGHNPEWTIEAAVEFIELNKDKPFYLHYATTLLHGPNTEWFRSLAKPEMTGEGLVKGYKSKYSTRATVMERVKQAGLSENEAGYTWMDDGLGILMDKLEELGIADNTVFVFVADHGSTRKGSLMKDRGMEVPFIVRWPAGIAKGSVSHELIQSTDFVPTWFELAGVKADPDYKIDGVSMAPVFKNPKQKIRDYVYGEIGAARSVKTKEWNYISLRYTKEQVEGIRAENKGFLKTALGLSGGVARSQFQKHGVDLDQLYKMTALNEGDKNFATSMEQKPVLTEMQAYLKQELVRFNRPYGEFISGANAVALEDQQELGKTLKKNTTIMEEARKKARKAKK